MTSVLELYSRATDGFAQRLDAVTADQWHAPTPCTDWDVRQLVGHVLYEQLWIAPLVSGETIAQVGDRFEGDQIGDDAPGAWRAARKLALESLSAEGALAGSVELSSGTESTTSYLWQVTADTLVHTWDLARAIGAWERLDPECVDAVTEQLSPQAEAWRAAGIFGAAVEVGEDADPQARLLALTGRRGVSSGADLGTILSVWAHPDDETYLCAGLMARAVQSGARVVCVTATRGELGSSDPERWPPGAALASIRTDELHRALGALGISEHHWLDYPDGGCAEVPAVEAVARLRALVQDVQPQTVLTFGPEGMTGHPDHQAVSRWTTEAVAGSGASLHYATNTPEWLARFREPLDALGAFMGSEPPCTAVEGLSVHVQLDGALLDLKLAAILHQTSQVEATVSALGESFLREGLAEESFRAAG